MTGERLRIAGCAVSLAIVNIVIAAPLFGLEHTADNGTIEGTFIAIARIMAKYPGQWNWWPLWNGGLPFENVYLPFSHWMVALFTLCTGLPVSRSFHIVTAALYAFSAVAVFGMALELSRRLMVSWIAALAYSCVSVSALIFPYVAVDASGAWNLRRLQVLVSYGESPHTTAVALLPIAIICFHRALTRSPVKWKILAGVVSACVVLSNAFGIIMLAAAMLCRLMAFPASPWWKHPSIAAAIGIATLAWVSPWLSPGMIRAIRANSMTTGGDFRYKTANWIALAAMSACFLLLWLGMRHWKVSPYLQFFALCAYIPTSLVLTDAVWKIALIPQPHRYQLEVDMVLLLALVFGGAAILDHIRDHIRHDIPARLHTAAVTIVLTTLTLQIVHSAAYARTLIRATDPRQTSEYRVAHWLDRNRPGERAMVSGSSSFFYNVFTDNPQLMGGHDQHTVNAFLPIVRFTIYSGMNAGDRDAEYSIFWLKAFGAHQISVVGPESGDFYRPFAHPGKFDGVLPLLWRDHGDSIYEVPMRSLSLAHVIPTSALVTRTPIHGLDIAPAQSFVAALEDPAYPMATLQWKGMSEAEIHATVAPGQVVSVQVTYAPGWEAWANGRRQKVRGDAIGLTVIETDCTGNCVISLRYTGGRERLVTRGFSFTALLIGLVHAWRGRRA